MEEGSGTDAAEAARRAREVVGWYGDPDSSWGIGVETRWNSTLGAAALERAWVKMVAEFPHLGTAGQVCLVDSDNFDSALEDALARPYRLDEPPVRVLIDEARSRLLVAAHHGVVDGLGLLALVGLLTGKRIESAARGIGERPAKHGFLVSGILRVAEAVFSPPGRFLGSGVPTAPGEQVHAVAWPARRISTADTCEAVLTAYRAHGQRRRPIILVGASRRHGNDLRPDRVTAYLRLRPTNQQRAAGHMAHLLRETPPEPAFPESSSRGIGPFVVGLLRNRLGGTVLISNLGLIRAEGIVEVRMFPAPSGPQAVALGLASTEHTTTLTLRTRAREFDPEQSAALFSAIVTATDRASA